MSYLKNLRLKSKIIFEIITLCLIVSYDKVGDKSVKIYIEMKRVLVDKFLQKQNN